MAKQILNLGRNWYALHTYSGYEDAVVRNLKKRIKTLNMENKIFNVIVPKVKKIKVIGNKRKTVEEKLYPGYVFVDMIVDDESWYAVRNTQRVTGFVGAGSIPLAIPEEQVDIIKKLMEEKEPSYKIDLIVGDMVKILEGPFKDYEGKTEYLDQSKGKIRILINLFGRETPLELDFLQVKKL